MADISNLGELKLGEENKIETTAAIYYAGRP